MESVSLLQLGAAVLVNSGFAWLLGAWCARRWLGASGAACEPALCRLDRTAAVLALVGSVAGLLAATAVMGGVDLGQALPMFWTMLSATGYGHAGVVTVLAMAALLLVRGAGALVLLAVFAVARASMGHAGENGWWTLPLAAEALHLAAIGLWTGVVMVSGWFVLGEARVATLGVHARADYLRRMSRAALLAVGAIAVTGIYNGWLRVGTAEHLLSTAYGATLLVKVALVLAAITLGGYNKVVGLPAAACSPQGIGRVRAVLRIETVLLLAALLAAAALTAQQPPVSLQA